MIVEMGEGDREKFKNITPSKTIIDLSLFEEPLSTEEGFRAEVQKLCPDERLPLVFPSLPTYFEARKKNLVTNEELRKQELSLPKSLYVSDTFGQKPELRGPMEEIIIAFEKERFRQGFSGNSLIGNGWSPTFKRRFKKIYSPKVGKIEASMEEEYKPDDGTKFPTKGRKIS